MLNQPIVLGYLLAGLLVGPNFDLFPTVVEIEGIKLWAEIGVIFLLFGLGLEFSFKKLIHIGGIAGITAVIEVFLTMFVGFFLGKILGWKEMDCLFFGAILAIGSTTIIVKSFDELGVKSQNFAGLVTGILVIEDLVAVILMVILSTLAVSRDFEGIGMLYSILKLAFFLVSCFVVGIYFIPTFLKVTKKFLTEETLLIVSVALCMLMVVLAHEAGFSPALGAFIMGSLLAETRKSERIEQLIKPLKNIFGAVFFVSVGMLINFGMIIEYYIPVLLGTLVLLFAKPLFVTAGALVTGQPLKTSIQAGMSLSQIGEFSFIIASLGLSLNVISEHLYPVAVAISVLTTFTTPFMIRWSVPFHQQIEKKLPAKWLKTIIQYGSGAQKVVEISEWRRYIRSGILNILIFSVVIIAIIALGNKFLLKNLFQKDLNHLLATTVTFLILTPFLWALAFRGVIIDSASYKKWNPIQRGPLVIMMIVRIGLVVFFIGLLFETFYSTFYAIMGVSCSIFFLLIFRKKIKSSYLRIEKRFVSNLNSREPQKNTKPLSPWDSHIATLGLHPALSIIGMPLHEARLREKFGINIAMIKRGDQIINVPGRHEKLFPADLVSVIGTDKHISIFKAFIDNETKDFDLDESSNGVVLQHFTIKENVRLVGKSIRASSIRELTKGLVVGIERNGQRILNPDSDFIMQTNDTIWLVGNEKRIQILIKEE